MPDASDEQGDDVMMLTKSNSSAESDCMQLGIKLRPVEHGLVAC